MDVLTERVVKLSHIHDVYDSDNKFAIDGISRAIKNNSTSKTIVMQFDHNSEVFTFELPRYIEGHDMTKCNRVEVHYLNIDTITKQENEGIYLVNDLTINADDETKLTCSWLISQSATQLVGNLNFLLRFICLTDDVIDYVWNTAIFSGIYVSKGIYNSDIVAEQYIDTIKAWENRLKVVENSIGSSGISPIIKITPITGGHKVEITDAEGTKIFNVLNGTNGTNGVNGADGISPTVSVSEITNGHRVVITDINSTQTFDVMDGSNGINGTDGKDGTNGSNGVDGVSPTLSVEAITGGHRVTITDVNGTQSFNVMDGRDGQNGADGSGVTEDRVLELINTQLGVVENGTY